MSEKAYELINILPQELRIGTLSEITPRILAMIDYLVKKKEYKLAIEQLNTSIEFYHFNNMMAELKRLNEKQLSIISLITKSPTKLKKVRKQKK